MHAPIREVHWEMRPPSRPIEEDTSINSNRKSAQLMLCPTEPTVAQRVRVKWLHLHYTIAHGRHYAIPTCISGPTLIKVKRVRATPRKAREMQVHRLIPPVPIMVSRSCLYDSNQFPFLVQAMPESSEN
ncbi:hypothetical protein L596_018570 [Steinernema carpocapsae]|uniref:Uncharacterized protein n=1 Tax=Steinernema carpocapsae TaxID=34508 RepID=A0A4U5N514_STECR|nr:hypothetical protein L596_018570 [Steinernema carpocapsae]